MRWSKELPNYQTILVDEKRKYFALFASMEMIQIHDERENGPVAKR